MHNQYVIALDQGTTSSRAMLVDAQGRAVVLRCSGPFPQTLPASRLGGARPAGHPVFPAGSPYRAAGFEQPHAGRHRQHRHHEPARDHGRVEPRDGRAGLQRHRVAVPPHRAHHREAVPPTRTSCAPSARTHGARARRVLLGEQDASGSWTTCPAHAEQAETGKARLRHGGQLARLDPHVRAGPRHRRDERRAAPCSTTSTSMALGSRGCCDLFGIPASMHARGAALRQAYFGRHRRSRRRAGYAHLRRGGRPAGGAVRPVLL